MSSNNTSYIQFSLTALLLACLIIPMGCQQRGQKAPRGTSMDELAEKIAAESQYDLVTKYDQNFASDAALDDFMILNAPTTTSTDGIYPYHGQGDMKIKDGRLHVMAMRPDNQATSKAHPRAIAWLDKPLPHTFRIEYEVEAIDKPSDLNFFVAGSKQEVSGIEFVLGGQDNSKNGIYVWYPKKYQHNGGDYRDKLGGTQMLLPLRKNRSYSIAIERDGVDLRFEVDGTMVVEEDEEASLLDGKKLIVVAPRFEDDLRYIGFSTWDNEIAIDNLKIREIEPHSSLKKQP